MKNHHLITGVLAVATASLLAASARAQDVPTTTGTDLVFEMRATTGSGQGYDYEADLGSYANFQVGGAYAQTANFSLSRVSISDISNFGGTPSGGYGSNWDSDGDVLWSVIGAGISHRIFATGEAADAPTGLSNTAQGSNANNIAQYVEALGNGSNPYGTETGASTEASFLSESSNTESYYQASGNTGTPNFFGQLSNTDFETVANGTSSALLYQINTSNSGAAGTELGTLTLTPTGLTFTGVDAAAVPEPSTWASIALGAAALLGIRRRRIAA
jgi:hypothetical protein